MNKLIFTGLVLLSLSGWAQTKKFTEKEYAQKTIWIQLMNTEGVNFQETLHAFAVYWQHHKMPEEEGDRDIKKDGRKNQRVSKKELKEIWAGAIMRFEIKKFMRWKIINQPYVKENGNIMTAEERLEFYYKYQQ